MNQSKRTLLALLAMCLAPIAHGLTYSVLNDAFDNTPGTPFNLQPGDPIRGNFSGNFSAVNGTSVNFTEPNAWSFTGRNFTFDFWINLTSSPASEQEIIWMENEIAFILLPSPVRLQFIIVSGTPCVGRSVQTGTLQPGVWYHITGTGGDNASITPYLSVNGTIVQQSDIFQSPLCNSAVNSMFGRHPTLTTRYLNARLDDMRIWSRTLTNSETYSFHNNGTEPSTSFLQAYYDFEGNFTTPIPPGAPVLSYVLDPDGQGAVLTWTTPIGNITGYVLTRGLAGATSYTFPSTTHSYHVHLLPTASTFTVYATGPLENGPNSNTVTLTASDRNLFGDNGSLTSDVVGQELSQGWFGTTAYANAAFATFGLLFVAIVVAGVSEYFGPLLALGFGFVACWLSWLFGWWPFWLLILSLIATIAAVAIFWRRGGNEDRGPEW